jgi:hypothetical protein
VHFTLEFVKGLELRAQSALLAALLSRGPVCTRFRLVEMSRLLQDDAHMRERWRLVEEVRTIARQSNRDLTPKTRSLSIQQLKKR